MKKRLSAQEYLALRSALDRPKKKPKRQMESVDQKEYVRFLNSLKIGFFYRVKNGGTYDAVRRTFRKNADLVCIPDLCGDKTNGPAVYIEVKRIIGVEKKKKLIFSAQISEGQKEFLLSAHRRGQLAGVAFTREDCLAIVMNDEERYPRHPRTYLFLPRDELELYAKRYTELKSAHALNNADPVKRVEWATKA